MAKVMIKHSDDRGRTWSAEQWYDLETDGDYLRRVRLHRQGASYGRIYSIAFTADDDLTLISGHARIGFGQ